MSGHDPGEFMQILEFENRITEVLAKYNVHLQNVPRQALAAAMHRMVSNRNRTWADIFPELVRKTETEQP